MLGLIKKDLCMIKGNLKTILLLIFVFGLMSINGQTNFSFIPAFISIVVMLSTFSYDEYNKTDAYIATFPNGKRNAVKAKYITTLFVLAISLLLSLIVTIIVSSFQNTLSLEELITTTLGCGAGVLLIQAIMYPIIYKFGVEKSRITMFVLSFGFVGIASFLLKTKGSITLPKNITTFLNQYGLFLFLLVICGMLIISYYASKQIYKRKEF